MTSEGVAKRLCDYDNTLGL